MDNSKKLTAVLTPKILKKLQVVKAMLPERKLGSGIVMGGGGMESWVPWTK